MSLLKEQIELSNLHTIWLVDDDDVMLQLLENYCKSFGFNNIECFESGDDLWAAIEAGKTCDAIVLDWKLKGISGLCLFNRIREMSKFDAVPILVISGLLKKDDFALLEEFPCTSLLEKPFTKKLLEPALYKIISESDFFKRAKNKLSTLIGENRKFGDAERKRLIDLLAAAPNPIPIAILSARTLRAKEMFAEARAVVEPVIRKNPTNIALLGELARIKFAEGNVVESKQILDVTNKLSPDNLNRLCFTGQVELNLNDPKKAREHFQKALSIDPDNIEAKQGVKLSESLSPKNNSSNSVPQGQVAYRIASTLNVIAVSKVRNGDLQSGMEQYRAALALLSDDDIAAKLAFNMGLGYLRGNQTEKALDWFKKSVELSKGLFDKASGYVARIEKSLNIQSGGDTVTPDVIIGEDYANLGNHLSDQPAGLENDIDEEFESAFNEPNSASGPKNVVNLKEKEGRLDFEDDDFEDESFAAFT